MRENRFLYALSLFHLPHSLFVLGANGRTSKRIVGPRDIVVVWEAGGYSGR